jgi:hypothetical protein
VLARDANQEFEENSLPSAIVSISLHRLVLTVALEGRSIRFLQIKSWIAEDRLEI